MLISSRLFRQTLVIATALSVSSFLPITAAFAEPSPTNTAETVNTQPGASGLKRPKVALALGGGGMRGAAHVKVLEVLTKEGVPIDMIVGTSIGSIVGGLYASGIPLEKIEESFQNGSLMGHFMTVPLWVRIVAAPVLFIPRLLGAKPYDGLYVGKKFNKWIASFYPDGPENHPIEKFKIPFRAVVVDVVSGNVDMIDEGPLPNAVQASSAVPGLRKPVPYGERLYVDGGVAANLPVEQARSMGADLVIAVNVDERFKPLPLAHFRKPGSISRRMVQFELWYNDKPAAGKADVLIHPNVDGISLISTKKKDARQGLQAGEEAAKAALPAIRALIPQLSVVESTAHSQTD